jgi:hypothetical protein
MQNVNRNLARTGQKLQNIGGRFSANFTAPILAGIALVTKGTEELRADLGRLETNTISAGENFGFIKDQLKDVNAITGEVDSSVEGLSNLLAAGFKGENLTKVLESVSGAAITFSDTLKFEGVADGLQETLATGAAIGPFAELLERSGISLDNFNRGLQQSIKQGTQQNFVLQTLASTGLAQVNAQYRENNKDVVEARKAQLDFQLAMADLGRIIQPIATKLTNIVTQLVRYFTQLSPQTKKFIVVLGGIAAAIGPLLALAGTILPAIATGFAALTGPIGLIIAGLTAVGVIIYKNWAPIKRTLIDIANYFIDLYNESTLFRVGVQSIINVFKNLFEVGKFIFETLKNIIGGFIDNVVNGFKTFGKVVKAIFTGNFSAIPDILKENTKDSAKTFKGFTKELANDWKNLTDGIKKNGQDAIAAITSRQKIAFIKEDVDATGVKDAVKDATAEGLKEGFKIPNGPQGSGRAQTEGLEVITAGTDIQSPIAKLNEKLPEEIQSMDEQLRLGLERMQAFREGLVRIVESTAESIAIGFGQFVAAFATGNARLGDLAGLLLTTIGDMAIQMGKLAIQVGIGIGAIQSALKSLNPAVAIAAGVALIALGSLVKSAAANIAGGDNLQAFANGGIVGGSSYYGDKILARVNSGELILNTNQQRSLYNQLAASEGGEAIQVEVIGSISGENINLAGTRAARIQNRRK